MKTKEKEINRNKQRNNYDKQRTKGKKKIQKAANIALHHLNMLKTTIISVYHQGYY